MEYDESVIAILPEAPRPVIAKMLKQRPAKLTHLGKHERAIESEIVRCSKWSYNFLVRTDAGRTYCCFNIPDDWK